MFDSEEYFTFDGVELAALDRELASANDERCSRFRFPSRPRRPKERNTASTAITRKCATG